MQFAGHEGELVDGGLDAFAERHACSVAGASFDADQDWVGACLGGLQGGGVLEAVGGEDAVVVIAGSDQGGRVTVAMLDVMERGIVEDCSEFLFVFRGGTVLFFPGPADGELVETEHVHDANLGDDGSKEVRSLELAGGNEKASVASSGDGELVWGCVLIGY